MKKKFIKKRLAVLLAALMMFPTEPVIAAGADGVSQVAYQTDDFSEKSDETGTDEEAADAEKDEEAGTSGEKNSPEESGDMEPDEEASETEEPDEGTAGGKENSGETVDEAMGGEEDGKAADDAMDSEEDEKAVDDIIDGEEDEETVDDVMNGEEADEAAGDSDADEADEDSDDAESDDDEEKLEEDAEDGDLEEELLLDATPSDALRNEPEDLVIFNTGSAEISVVGYEDFVEYELGDAYFEEDGSFTINIPEANPFFPYEVQFTADGETTNEWFMTPDDTVEVGGHTFEVSAYFDDTVITQMSLEVGGETVMVYPEEKEFSNDGGISAFSLLPLEEDWWTVDLTGFSPIELTMVKIDSLFAGQTELKDTDQIVWQESSEDGNYTISSQGDVVDLSHATSYGGTTWEMIVGKADQLQASNMRYYISVDVDESDGWMIPTAYKQDEAGVRSQMTIEEYRYDDDNDERYLEFEMLSEELSNVEDIYVALSLNLELFANTSIKRIEAYEGSYTSAADAEAAERITDQILCSDMFAADAGYLKESYEDIWVTLVAYDAAGNVVGCLPVFLENYSLSDYVDAYLRTSEGYAAGYSTSMSRNTRYRTRTFQLYEGNPTDAVYSLVLEYCPVNESGTKQVTGAFIGKYESLAKATAAGARNIKDSLFGEEGYAADFSKGVDVTVFVGENENSEQTVYTAHFVTEAYLHRLNDSTYVTFDGLNDKDGNSLYGHYEIIGCDNDDYGDDNFVTIVVDDTVDLTALAPEFSCIEGINLYAPDSSAPEVSGESVQDFSKEAIQYTASSESKEYSKNYWLHIVKMVNGKGMLYTSSLADPEAKTTVENGIIYSTREMFLDGRYDYKHDILLINMGTEPLEKLSVELESDQVALDSYWTLTGENDFQGFNGTDFSDAWNQAKLRLVPKDENSDADISGTLTIKAGETTLMVLTLTGVVGDPRIITTEIPDAVKYVHYGTMIQNSNKYDFNTVSYYLRSGSLPDGMVLKSNGELYGVPKETGEFTFKVRMENSYDDLEDSEAELTLTVVNNTNRNVDSATDENYDLIERVPNITLSNTSDYTMTSIGVFDEWVNLYLDGEMLTEGVDYDAESGSTRLTIRSQTLKAGNTVGTHTLSAEFRTSDNHVMKRAAQNYNVTRSGGSSDGSSDRSSSTSQNRDAKKGYMSSQSGIITGDGSGYSHWSKDDNGWKLIYADGTAAAGSVLMQADGNQVEQVLWEKINGSYYAFGANGYLSTGWVYDYLLNGWYYVSENSGMMSGWYQETQDGQTYYLNPADGALAHGWKEIAGKWYYLNEVSAMPTWNFDPVSKTWFYNVASRTKPWGALYRNEMTPDGYQVDEDGVWNGR